MGIYSRALNHIDMTRVKELREEKIKRKKDAKEYVEQIRNELINLNSPEFSDWRCNIDEGMTSSGLFQTTLPATGDLELVPTTDNVTSSNFTTNLNWSASDGVATSSDSSSMIIPGASHTVWRRADMKIPLPADQHITTVVVKVVKGGGASSWTDRDPAENFDSDMYLSVSGGAGYNSMDNISSGTYTFIVDPKGSSGFAFVNFGQFSRIGQTQSSTVEVSLQRRTPTTVFVPLDSPEATAFIRTDPVMAGLSAEERKKKLMDMLDAGDEYLLKYLGIIGSKARPSDTTMPDSWEDSAETNPEPYMDIKTGDTEIAAGGATDAMSDDLYNWVNKTYGLPAAEWKKDNPTKPDNSNPFLPKGSYVPKASGGKDYGNIAANQGPSSPVKNYDGKIMPNPGAGKPGKVRLKPQFLPKASKKQKSMVAHHEPEGEVLSEKKKLKSPKDITSKIPGYYDGKPAPLGFPMQEPPKMVNGFHPDLVDGKKIANRFNRLDPQSAKAMPPTGNPHIDKKVRAAAKKPK